MALQSLHGPQDAFQALHSGAGAGAGGNRSGSSNTGLSVASPAFACAYAKHVLPLLSADGAAAASPTLNAFWEAQRLGMRERCSALLPPARAP